PAGTFVTDADLPANAGVVGFTVTPLPDGRVLMAGGSTKVDGTPVDTALIFDLDAKLGTLNILHTASLAVARAGHQATVLCDGTLLFSGGTTSSVPAERYNPSPAGRR